MNSVFILVTKFLFLAQVVGYITPLEVSRILAIRNVRLRRKKCGFDSCYGTNVCNVPGLDGTGMTMVGTRNSLIPAMYVTIDDDDDIRVLCLGGGDMINSFNKFPSL